MRGGRRSTLLAHVTAELDHGRPHLHPVGVAPVQLGLDQRYDVDLVDPQVLQPSGDLHVDQVDVDKELTRMVGESAALA